MRKGYIAAVVLWLGFGASGIQAVRAQGGPRQDGRATVVSIVRVTVPPILKLVVDPTRVGPDGAPVVSVITNIPELRRTGAPLTELISDPSADFKAIRRTRGGASGLVGGFEVDPGLIRYSIYAP